MAEANSINASTTGIVGNTGTGFTGTAVTAHNILVGGSTSSTITNVSPGTSTFVLTSNGASSDPSFQTVSASGAVTEFLTNISGPITPSSGAIDTTQATTTFTNGSVAGALTIEVNATNHNLLIGAGGGNAARFLAPNATSGIPLVSTGASSDPAYQTAVVAGGGTGSTTFNTNGAVYSNTTTTGVLQSASLTDGQFLIGSSTGAPAAAALTGGTGVTVTNGHNSSSIAIGQAVSTSSGVTFGTVTSTGNVSSNGNVTLGNNSITLSGTDNGTIDVNTGGTKVRYIVAAGTLHIQNNSNADMMTLTQGGNINITGSLTKGSGTFKIDHPLDPKNKFLYHSFVESPDMLNIYTGIAKLDDSGEAWVDLPEYFEALNRDFTYQLTSIGVFSNVYVAKEISDNSFLISGGRPNATISWQVTGVRKDPYALANPVIPEVEKTEQERGTYLHPDVYK